MCSLQARWFVVVAACAALFITASCTSDPRERPADSLGRSNVTATQESAAPTSGTQVPAQTADAADTVAPRMSGSRLAFVAGSLGGRGTDVFTSRLDGSHRRQLTHSGHAWWPSWSPDGKQLAYVDTRPSGRLVVMSSSGRDARVVAATSVTPVRPAWSPDGARLAYLKWTDGRGRLVITTLSTGAVSPVATPRGVTVESFDWSPDGQRFALAGRTRRPLDSYTTVASLFTVRTDGSDRRRLTTSGEVAEPAWSPDGRQIVYHETSTTRGGISAGRLHTIPAGGGRATPVPVPSGRGEHATWSPDGRFLSLTASVRDEQGSHRSLSGVWIVRRDGTRPVLVLPTAQMPDWSPVPASGFRRDVAVPPWQQVGPLDHRLVFLAVAGSGPDVIVLNHDGSFSLLTHDGLSSWLSLAPSGDRLLYGRAPEPIGHTFGDPDGAAAWSVDLGVNDSVRLLTGWAAMQPASSSPDSSRMAVARDCVISSYDLGRKRYTPLTHVTSGWFCAAEPAWSPDGRWIAFVRSRSIGYRSDVFVVRTDGTGLRQVTTWRRGEVTQPDWSPDSAWIAYTHLRWAHDESRAVYAVRRDGSDQHLVLDTPGVDDSPAWSPDGRRIALYSDGPPPGTSATRPGIWTLSPDGRNPTWVVKSRTVLDIDW